MKNLLITSANKHLSLTQEIYLCLARGDELLDKTVKT